MIHRKSKRRNILIIGANGFVGKALVPKLFNKNNDLFLVSRNKSFKYAGAKVWCGDLNNLQFNKKIVMDIDIVYYLASYKKNLSIHTGVPFDVVSGNVSPLIHFLEAVKNSKVKKIVYISSSIVAYAQLGADKIDGYVSGKYINEFVLESFASQTGIDVKIVRSAAIYGPGDNVDPMTSNLIPALIVKTQKAKDDIVLWGKGIRRLQFIYIDDLINNLIAISRSKENFFVIGNNEAVKIKDLVVKINKLMNKKLRIILDPTKPDKPTKLIKFKNIVTPKVTIDAGLKKTINFIL